MRSEKKYDFIAWKLKKVETSSNWDFDLNSDSKLFIIPAMLFFTVLGLTKAPQKLNTGYRIDTGSDL